MCVEIFALKIKTLSYHICSSLIGHFIFLNKIIYSFLLLDTQYKF